METDINVYTGLAFMFVFITGFTSAGYFGWLIRNNGSYTHSSLTTVAFVAVTVGGVVLLTNNLSQGGTVAGFIVYIIVCIGAALWRRWDIEASEV